MTRSPRTPPWVAKGKAFSSEEVWLIDTTKVLEEADAVIVHGFQGGSTGVGIELALAFGRGIPVLYVHHDTCEVTRMVKGMPALVEVKPFFDHGDDGTHELRRIVREWLIKWRPVIAEGPANRRSLVDLFGPTQRSLREKWKQATQEERARVAFTARMTPSEVAEYLSNPLRMSSLPTSKLMLLGSALGESVPLLLAPHWRPPPLTTPEVDALQAAAAEYEWGPMFAQTIENVARVHKEVLKRKSLVARQSAHYDFGNPSEWVRFMEDWQRGQIA